MTWLWIALGVIAVFSASVISYMAGHTAGYTKSVREREEHGRG